MSRIQAAFQKLKSEKRTGLITFLPVGFPDPDSTVELALAMAEGGADIIELGIPFSDPLADGVTVQRASFSALAQGATIYSCIETVRRVREAGLETPLVFMGYYNPIFSMGVERFCQDAAKAGVDGLIVVDLPPEESGELLAACRKRSLDLIFLLAPTSTDIHIETIARLASGFIYCVSLTGVTGARGSLAEGLWDFLRRVKEKTEVPLAVGFGLSTREHIESVGHLADAAVVGSALIEVVERAAPGERAAKTKEYVEYLAGRTVATPEPGVIGG